MITVTADSCPLVQNESPLTITNGFYPDFEFDPDYQLQPLTTFNFDSIGNHIEDCKKVGSFNFTNFVRRFFAETNDLIRNPFGTSENGVSNNDDSSQRKNGNQPLNFFILTSISCILFLRQKKTLF